MNKKVKIVIFLLIIVLMLVIVLNKKNNNMKEFNVSNNQNNISYDEKSELYYIRDDATNEIVSASESEEGLLIYKEHPDYNPNPLAPRSDNLRDFVDIEEFENQELNDTENLEIVGEQ